MENNTNLTVIITRGLQASGKSTFAREWVAEDPENRVVVEKDEIRKDSRLFKDGVYNHRRGDEHKVIRERDRLINDALLAGKSVISSDTNLVQKHINRITNIANEYGASVVIKDFLDVPLHELIERDKNRENSVGEQVIRENFHKFVKTMPTFLEYDPELPFCIVSDLDGTLTKGPKNRSPYDLSKVGNDEVNEGLAFMLDVIDMKRDGKKNWEKSPFDRLAKQFGIGDYDCKLFIFSGRDEVCRPETEDWLERNDIRYDELHMRRSDHVHENGDSVGDEIVKAEMIEKYIRGKYNILIWFDDRPKIVRMLKDVYGVNVCAFGDQRYEF